MRNIGGFSLGIATVMILCGQATRTSRESFTVTITATKSTMKLGESAMIDIVLKSTSQGKIRLSQERHAGNSGE